MYRYLRRDRRSMTPVPPLKTRRCWHESQAFGACWVEVGSLRQRDSDRSVVCVTGDRGVHLARGERTGARGRLWPDPRSLWYGQEHGTASAGGSAPPCGGCDGRQTRTPDLWCGGSVPRDGRSFWTGTQASQPVG